MDERTIHDQSTMSANLIALQNRFLGRGETLYDRLAQLKHDKGALHSHDLLALAKDAKLPPAMVRSVAKFYDDLALEEPAARTLRVCNGEACAIGGSADCHARLESALAARDDVRVAEVTCVGYCGSGPNAILTVVSSGNNFGSGRGSPAARFAGADRPVHVRLLVNKRRQPRRELNMIGLLQERGYCEGDHLPKMCVSLYPMGPAEWSA